MQDLDSYIKETILYCDDEEELIAVGAVLQIMSKNILTTVIDKSEWKSAIFNFAENVEDEIDFGSLRKKYGDYEF